MLMKIATALTCVLAMMTGRLEAAPLTTNAALAIADEEMKAFSNDDRAAFLGSFAPEATVVDDTPPFGINGKEAIAHWYDANRGGVRDVAITRGAPSEAVLSPDGNRCFLVLPISISGHGPKGGAFSGKAMWIAVLESTPDGLRIVSLSIGLL